MIEWVSSCLEGGYRTLKRSTFGDDSKNLYQQKKKHPSSSPYTLYVTTQEGSDDGL